jgi:hypothetical protein
MLSAGVLRSLGSEVLGSVEVLEHTFPVLDLAAAEAAGVRTVEAGRMRFETVLLLAQREANDHESDCILLV